MTTKSSQTTTNHNVIRKWAEERGGWPATVKGTAGNNGVGVLRIGFTEGGESLERISWEEFFDKFEQQRLAFLYQEETHDGQISRFFKLVSRE